MLTAAGLILALLLIAVSLSRSVWVVGCLTTYRDLLRVDDRTIVHVMATLRGVHEIAYVR